MRIGIRSDGGIKIGIGHIERCLILAQELCKNGNEAFFICKQDKKTTEKIQSEGFRVLELSPDLTLDADLRMTLRWLKIKRVKVIVTDSYKIDENYLNKLASIAKLITIDDLAKFPFPSDIVINQGIRAKKLPYCSSTGKTKFLLGPKFTLLRSEYSNLRKREIKPKVKKVLVTLGATDSLNLMPKILKTLGGINQSFNITLTMGPFFTNREEIVKVMQKFQNRTIRLISFKKEFYKILLDHDLVITGGGTTTYALAATGTPALGFFLVNNQGTNVQDLADYGILINLGWGNKINEIRLKESIVNLMDNFCLREKMAKLGQALVDGKGTRRICSVIQHGII